MEMNKIIVAMMVVYALLLGGCVNSRGRLHKDVQQMTLVEVNQEIDNLIKEEYKERAEIQQILDRTIEYTNFIQMTKSNGNYYSGNINYNGEELWLERADLSKGVVLPAYVKDQIAIKIMENWAKESRRPYEEFHKILTDRKNMKELVEYYNGDEEKIDRELLLIYNEGVRERELTVDMYKKRLEKYLEKMDGDRSSNREKMRKIFEGTRY